MPDDLSNIQNLYSQRRTKIRPPQKMADVLSGLLSKRGYARVLSTGELDDAWQAACGDRFAGDTRAGEVRRGALEVLARSSAVVQELTFIKKKLLAKLKDSAPDHKIKDLRFRVGAME
jgi:predicted nucleic acid-binding Zn ribbon protein